MIGEKIDGMTRGEIEREAVLGFLGLDRSARWAIAYDELTCESDEDAGLDPRDPAVVRALREVAWDVVAAMASEGAGDETTYDYYKAGEEAIMRWARERFGDAPEDEVAF